MRDSMPHLEQLAKALQERLQVREVEMGQGGHDADKSTPAHADWHGNPDAAVAHLLGQAQHMGSGPPPEQRKIMALCCLGPRPDTPAASGSSGSSGSSGALGGSSNQAQLIRLVSIPQHCSHAQLVHLLTRGLVPPLRFWPPCGVRIAYCLPALPLLVDVCDDQDVALMWEEVEQHPGGGRLQIYWDWDLPEQPPEAQQNHYHEQQQQQQQSRQQQQRRWKEPPQQQRKRHASAGLHLPPPDSPSTGSDSSATSTITDPQSFPSISSASTPPAHGCASARSSLDRAMQAQEAQHTAGGPGSPALVNRASSLRSIPPSELLLNVLLSSQPSLFGPVYEGRWRGCRVAVRCLNWPQPAGRPFGDAASERALLSTTAPLASLTHPHLVEIHGVVLRDGSPVGTPDSQLHVARAPPSLQPPQQQRAGQSSPLLLRAPALVMGWVGGGTLRAALSQPHHPLVQSGAACLLLLRQVAEAMAYLHSCGVTHFTLTPASILLGAQDRLAARVGGYELPAAKLAALTSPHLAFRPDVLPWLAPELLKGTAPVTEKVDVYSFAIIMWELWARRPPYDCVRFSILADSMRGSGVIMRPIIPGRQGVPQPVPGWRPLMERCWAEDPAARPSFQELRQELRALAHQ